MKGGALRRKLLITDVDGTLLHERVGISPDVVDMAQRFVQSGHLLALCTGRSPRGVQDVAALLPINVPCPLMTGSVFYDFTAKAVIRQLLLDSSIRTIVRMMMARYPNLAIQTFTAGDIMTISSNDIFRTQGVAAEQQRSLTPLEEALPDEVCKVLIVHEDRGVLGSCKELIEGFERGEHKGPCFKCDFASRHFMEIVSVQAGKDNAVLHLSQQLRVPQADCFVAGDGLTDLPMFQHAGTTFAPRDAIAAVREAADIVFPSAKEHGIVEVFRYIMAGTG